MDNSKLKSVFIIQTIIFLIAIVLIAGGAYYAGTRNAKSILTPEPQNSIGAKFEIDNSNSVIKEYFDESNRYSFSYPSFLSLTKNADVITLSHTTPFDNYDGGCDMKGDAILSKTINDLYLKIYVVPQNSLSVPSYAENYSAGELNGKKAYIGAEGCGRTSYYFPISGNRILVIDKSEVQILSAIVSPEVRSRLLSVPGVIPQEEGNKIVEQIIESIFVDPVILKTVN